LKTLRQDEYFSGDMYRQLSDFFCCLIVVLHSLGVCPIVVWLQRCLVCWWAYCSLWTASSNPCRYVWGEGLWPDPYPSQYCLFRNCFGEINYMVWNHMALEVYQHVMINRTSLLVNDVATDIFVLQWFRWSE
jgi:hypothetical protein